MRWKVAMLVMFLCGCSQTHFAPYISAQEQLRLKDAELPARIEAVTGIVDCGRCLGFSKIVWFAANSPEGVYEGYTAIPVANWEAFVKETLESPASMSGPVRIDVERIVLTTWWSDPAYHACEVKLSVERNGVVRRGAALIKIATGGEELLSESAATLTPAADKVIRLALIAAYADATR